MLNRSQLEEFLERMFEEKRIELPEDIEIDDVVEAFCQCLDDDLSEWLKVKFFDFFLLTSGESTIDWDWIRQSISSL